MILRRYSKSENIEVAAKIDYDSINFTELKSIAKNKGINSHKMKKEELVEALNALEG